MGSIYGNIFNTELLGIHTFCWLSNLDYWYFRSRERNVMGIIGDVRLGIF